MEAGMMEAGMTIRKAPVMLDKAMTLLNGTIADDKSEPLTAEEQKIIEKMLERNFNANVKNVIRQRTSFLKNKL